MSFFVHFCSLGLCFLAGSSLISTVRVHNYTQSQAHRNMVRKASQLGYKGQRLNFLVGDKESVFLLMLLLTCSLRFYIKY